MAKISPISVEKPLFCIEKSADPAGLIIFGASGDLASRKILPALYSLFLQGLLNEKFYILGASRKKMSDIEFNNLVLNSLEKFAKSSEKRLFAKRCSYLSGDYSDQTFYEEIKKKIEYLNKQFQTGCANIFYYSVPPSLFEIISFGLNNAKIAKCSNCEHCSYPRIVVEKPFGRDLDSARQLDETLHRYFKEKQIYRIDHYLGKETVQNILMFRFANSIFEPLWNRNYIDNVEITISESGGIEHRGGYYDQSGAMRDMFQNHLLQILALVAMESPAAFDANAIRDEKVKLLKSIRPFDLKNLEKSLVRGQYDNGILNGEKVVGYLDEQGVDKKSKTETFAAARIFIDNWRWKSVPFYLRTGKRLSEKVSAVAIKFKEVPHSMFASSGIESPQANILTIKIQPEEGISLSFQAKRPGSKTCMGTIKMDFDYKTLFGLKVPEAYSRLLLDVMTGDQTLFARADEVLTAWELVTPVLLKWQKSKSNPIKYPSGCESFKKADDLIAADGKEWTKYTTSAEPL